MYYSTGKVHQNEENEKFPVGSSVKVSEVIHKFALLTYKNIVIIGLSKFIFFQSGKNSIFLLKYCKHV